ERCDGKLLVVRATHPCGLELRPEVQQEKCPRRAGHVGELGEQSLALRIDPVGVVEMNHERTGGAAGAEQPSEQACDQSLLLDGVSRRLGGRWIGHGEEVVRDRKSTRLNSSHDQISYAVFCLK